VNLILVSWSIDFDFWYLVLKQEQPVANIKEKWDVKIQQELILKQ